MYCEDEDFVYVSKIGLELIKINSLKIYHKGGSSEPYHNYDYFVACKIAHKFYSLTNTFQQTNLIKQ